MSSSTIELKSAILRAKVTETSYPRRRKMLVIAEHTARLDQQLTEAGLQIGDVVEVVIHRKAGTR